MTSPDAPQLQETPDAAAGTMVRACDRCGTVCSTDQEWCLNCGVRMTEPSQRLPGLRAAGLVVSLAVLLAGGAAAASYAALRGDARSAANVPAETTGTPVAQAPVTTAPVTPTTTPSTPTTASVPDTSSAPDTSTLDTSGSGDTADDSPSGADDGGTSAATPSTSTPSTSAPSTSTPPAATPGTGGGGSKTGSGGGKKDTGSTKGDDGSKGGDDNDDDAVPTTGPVEFATGQGTIYDPDGVVADPGDQTAAIDGSTSKSWKVALAPQQTGGFGYVLDFDPATKLKNVDIVSGTKGATVKVLGTKRSTLPPDALDNGWDTLADETTLKTGDNVIPLQAVSGASSKYKHVLVFVTETPGTPAALTIREIKATR